MATTIRDVAHRAGVSIATVSRALRDADSVTPETRARVTQAATELEYVPSQLGRQLAQGRHAANGIVFPDLSGPYYAEVVLGYESVAAQLERSVLILSTQGRRDERALVTGLAARCDGWSSSVPTVDDDVVHRLTRRGTPVVLVARSPLADADSVNAENSASGALLGEHLVAAGARTIRFVGDPAATSDVTERFAAIKAAAERDGATVSVDPVSDFSEDAGTYAARAALAGRRTTPLPDAFACANDELALGLLLALRRRRRPRARRHPRLRLGRRDGRPLRRADDCPAADAGTGCPRRATARPADQPHPRRIPSTRFSPPSSSSDPAPPHPQEEPPDEHTPDHEQRPTAVPSGASPCSPPPHLP